MWRTAMSARPSESRLRPDLDALGDGRRARLVRGHRRLDRVRQGVDAGVRGDHGRAPDGQDRIADGVPRDQVRAGDADLHPALGDR
jgi:hypothetical protein